MRILRKPPATHSWTEGKLAVITGLSNPNHCELSAIQQVFLQGLNAPAHWKLHSNFPFVAEARGTPSAIKPPGISRASIANGWQFLRSRRLAKWAEPHWMSLLQSTDQLFVIAGSCGLQLLLDGLEWLEGSDEMSCKRIEVIALGPVASHDLVIKNKNRAETDACRLRLTTVQGTADWISRPFCRHPDIRISHLGHLGYWQSDKVREIVHSWLHNRLSVLSELEATCLNDDFPQKISTSG